MASSRWAVLDCGKHSSVENCKIKLSAPEDQVEKLLDIGTYHAAQSHGHENNQVLRNELKKLVEYQEVKS